MGVDVLDRREDRHGSALVRPAEIGLDDGGIVLCTASGVPSAMSSP